MVDFNANGFRHNHYVPEWYQRRFLAKGAYTFHYLDLNPATCCSGSATWTRRDLLRWGPKKCFAQEDLYTVKWGNLLNTDVERFFFGQVDQAGKESINFFSNFQYNRFSEADFHSFLRFLSVQKLRTPKGLAAFQKATGARDTFSTLAAVQRHRDLHCALWAECVWQIADASRSKTKFIISDHPVTVYNRECFPGSTTCNAFSDPAIDEVGTHTYFPLDKNQVLILTNLAWVRNPYQSARKIRPNPSRYRTTVFNFFEVQTGRHLSEEEVIEINYVTKRRAYRYIAAAEEEWLYPEKKLRDDHWRRLGDGFLFMPEPRRIFMGGEVTIGYESGRSASFSEYGHRPWQLGYKDKGRFDKEEETLERFKAEWAASQGPEYRGLSAVFGSWAQESVKTGDSPEMHSRYLAHDEKTRRLPGERRRRRSLQRRP